MAKIVTTDYTLDVAMPQLEHMSDDEFFSFCVQNKNIKIERDENHQILIMPPEGNFTANENFEIAFELGTWIRKNKSGIGFGTSVGFTLPDNSVRSPDVAWVSMEKWEQANEKDKEKFAHIVPDFIVELMSPSDNQKDAMAKMEMWRRNGVRLGWLIDPQKQETFIYRIDGTIHKVEGFNNILSGEDVLPGFELNLTILT
jgi:Uma2 family endonuclease